MPIYNLNGKKYDIPEKLVSDFERENPSATQPYSVGETNYDIPVGKRDKFLKRYPDAVQGYSEKKRTPADNVVTEGQLDSIGKEVDRANGAGAEAPSTVARKKADASGAKPIVQPSLMDRMMGTRMSVAPSDAPFKSPSSEVTDQKTAQQLFNAGPERKIETPKLGLGMGSKASQQGQGLRLNVQPEIALTGQAPAVTADGNEQTDDMGASRGATLGARAFADSLRRKRDEELAGGDATAQEMLQNAREREQEARPVTMGDIYNQVINAREAIGPLFEVRDNPLDPMGRSQFQSTPEDRVLSEQTRATRMLLEGAKESFEVGQQERDDSDSFMSGLGSFGRSTLRKLYNPNTLTFGLEDMVVNSAVSKAVDAMDAGTATPAQEALVDAAVMKMMADGYKAANSGHGLAAGETTGEMLPFIIEMVVNPVAAAGQGAAKKVATVALKRFAGQLGKGGVRRMAAKTAARTAGLATNFALSIPKGAAMAVTTGAPHVIADYMSRRTGELIPDYEGGEVTYGGREGQEDVGEAIFDAIVSQGLERSTEMSGSVITAPLAAVTKKALTGAGKVVGNAAAGALNKMGLGSVVNWTRRLTPTKLAETISNIEKRAHWQGTIDEYFEEVDNNILNALTVGDMDFGTGENGVFNLETNIDTFLGVAALGGSISMSKMLQGGYRALRGKTYQAKQELKDAESDCEALFGREWKFYKDLVDGSSADELAHSLSGMVWNADANLRTLSPEQFRSLLSYAAAQTKLDAMQAVGQAQSAEDPVLQGEQEAFEAGEQAPIDDYFAMAQSYLEAESTARQSVGDAVFTNLIERHDQMSPSEWMQVLNGLSEPEAEAVNGYIQARSNIDGALNRVREEAADATRRKESAVRIATSNLSDGSGGEVNTLTTGMVDGNEVYVLGNTGNTMFVIDPNTLEKQIVPESKVENVQIVDADDYVASMREQAQDEANRNADWALTHHPETQPIAVGSEIPVALEGGEGRLIVTRQDGDNWEAVQGEYDAETGTWKPKGGEIVQVLSGDQLLQMQDEFYTARDLENAGVEEEAGEGGNIIPAEETGQGAEGGEGGEGGNIIPAEETGQGEVQGQQPQQGQAPVQGEGQVPQQGQMPQQGQASAEADAAEAERQARVQRFENDDFSGASAEEASGWLFDEAQSGLTGEEADAYVEAKRKEAAKNAEKLDGKAPKMGTNIAEFKRKKSEWQAQQEAASQAVKFWDDVKQQRDRKTGRDLFDEDARFSQELQQAISEAEGNREAMHRLMETEPETLEEVAADMLANGSRVMWADEELDGTRLRGASAHTGYSREDVKRMPFVFASHERGGMSVDAFGEAVLQEARDRGIRYDEDDAMAGVNALLSVLGSVRTQGDINNYVARNRIRDAREIIRQDEIAREEYEREQAAGKAGANAPGTVASGETAAGELPFVPEEGMEEAAAQGMQEEAAGREAAREEMVRRRQSGETGQQEGTAETGPQEMAAEGAGSEEEAAARETALASRIEESEDFTEEDGANGKIYRSGVVVDGKHRVTKVDEPNEKGDYTGSWYEYDGQRFGDLQDVVRYIEKNSALDNTTDTGETSERGERDDTATTQDTVSDSKGSESAGNEQGNGEIINKDSQSGNRLVTDEQYEELRRRLKAKFGQLNVGLDPETAILTGQMMVYHIERGVRKLVEVAKKLVEDFGDAVRPYLRSSYEWARAQMEDEGVSTEGMTPYEEARKFDAANFDKTVPDVMETANVTAAENELAKKEREEKPQETEKRDSYNAGERVVLDEDGKVYRVEYITTEGDVVPGQQNSYVTYYHLDGKPYNKYTADQLSGIKRESKEIEETVKKIKEIANKGGRKAEQSGSAVSLQPQEPDLFSQASGNAEGVEASERTNRSALSPTQGKEEAGAVSGETAGGEEAGVTSGETAGGEEAGATSEEAAGEVAEKLDGRLTKEGQARIQFMTEVATSLMTAVNHPETGRPYKGIKDLREEAKKSGMYVDEKGSTDILLQELVEEALVRVARLMIKSRRNDGRTGRETFEAIKRLYDMQPNIGQRSSERVRMQQYSTPLPMAFVADMWAYRDGMESVLEPTAGNGMLVIGVPKEVVHANELDKTRLGVLRRLNFQKVTNQDATRPFGGAQYDSVIMNPPFGSAEAKEYDGVMIEGLDPQITLNALASMKDDGTAAIIIGGNMEYAPNGAIRNKRDFFCYLYDHYNVAGVVDMAGDLYARQGTTYPTRMILINGRRSEEERAQTTVYPPVQERAIEKVTTFDELYDKVLSLKNSNKKTNGTEILRTQTLPLDGGERHGGRPERNRPSVEHNANDGNERGGRELSGGVQDTGRDASGTVRRAETQRGIVAVRPGDASVSGAQEREGWRSNVSSRGRGGADEQSGRNGLGELSERGTAGSRVGLTGTEEKKRGISDEKLPYRRHNTAFSLESVAPAAMVEAMDENLKKIEKEVGNIEEWVTKELGYDTVDAMHNALAGEQVDSVAMAIYQMKQGQALIIGDQTGVGKGRQMAALIRWAVKQGKKPIFMTQKAELFTDIYRDLVDVGSGELRPFILNADGAMLDSDENKVYSPLSKPKQDKVMEEVVRKAESSSTAGDGLFNEGEDPLAGYDYIVLTYSQVNKGDAQSRKEAADAAKASGKRSGKKQSSKAEENPLKAQFVRAMAKDNYLMLDESHTAAGESNQGAYIQSIVKTSKAVTFASATYAKRPDTMPLYALRTVMGKANVEASELIEVIQKGGVTLQEIMSRALTAAGQMVRRERDMSDVQTDWKTIDDPKVVSRSRDNYDKTIEAFNDIIAFQEAYIKPFIDQTSKDLAVMASSAGLTKGTEKIGVQNVPFASKTYNYTKQLMLALKVDAIIDEVVKEIEAGRHPVIALESTMESAYDGYSPGDVIEEPTFAMSLLKGLDSVMSYTQKNGGRGKEMKMPITPQQLGPAGEQAYYELREKIRQMTSGVFISPLDAIIEGLQARGYRVGELTGRNTYLERQEDGSVIVRKRTKEQRDKKKRMGEFNRGEVDVLILNKSASTGISLHASSKFSDRRQRSMVIAQPLSDINDYMQMIGRIDRTGQVHRGYYINLGLPVPAEQRFLMMLSTKLKSLNANTTTSQDNEDTDVEAPDLLNKYGSQVVVEYLRDNKGVYEQMGEPLKKGNEPVSASGLDDFTPSPDDEVARKITGYVALLPTEQQEAFYTDVIRRYTELIQYLNETESNDLKITVMPLRAETLEKKVSSKGVDPTGDNPFAQNAYWERVMVDVLRKPMKASDVRALIDKLNKPATNVTSTVADLRAKTYSEEVALRDKLTDGIASMLAQVDADQRAKLDKEEERYEKARAKMEESIAAHDDKIRKSTKMSESDKEEAIRKFRDEAETALDSRNFQNKEEINRKAMQMRKGLKRFKVGGTYLIPDTLDGNLTFDYSSPGIFCGYKSKSEGLTESTTFAVFATLDGRKRVEVKLSAPGVLQAIEQHTMQNYDAAQRVNLDNWDEMIPTSRRKEAYILTGNIIQALSDSQGSQGGFTGQLISFTDVDGNVRDGVLMPEKWSPTQLRSAGVPINARMADIRAGKVVKSTDNKVVIGPDNSYRVRGVWYDLAVPKTKKEGAKFYQNADLIRLVTDGNFYERGGMFHGQVHFSDLQSVLDILSQMGVRVKEAKSSDADASDTEAEDSGVRFRGGDDVFVSNALRAVEGIKQDKATPEQWLRMIEKAGGLKAGEDKWMGLSDWLKGQDKKTLTKQEVLDYIRENEIEVEDVEYSEPALNGLQEEFDEIFDRIVDGVDSDEVVSYPAEQAWEELRANHSGGDDFDMAFYLDDHLNIHIGDENAAGYFLGTNPINSTRLDYTTEGLENKREIALVVPSIEPWNEGDELHFGDAGNGRAIAWVRFGETTDADGRRVLVIDEIQSKRHQEGREKGYLDKGLQQGIENLAKEYQKNRRAYAEYEEKIILKYDILNGESLSSDDVTKRILEVATQDEIERLRKLRNAELSSLEAKENYEKEHGKLNNLVPDAPFDKNWHELAMKRMLRYAAENGYDKVAWTKGAQQAERYDIGQAVEKITWENTEDGKIITIDAKNTSAGQGYKFVVDGDGRIVRNLTRYNLHESELVGKPLADLVGKELADKIMSDDGEEVKLPRFSYYRLSGNGLHIGGEGMKGFYDQILPRFMDKYGKKWGVKTGEVDLPNVEEAGRTMWSVDVTPEMRESVMQGQSLFRSSEQDIKENDENLTEDNVLYREVTDAETLERLENEPTIKVYRAMQLIDGKLYPPMSAKVNGELRKPSELGVWEEAEENPELADDRGYFKLDKGNKKGLKARYNPYIHTSATMLNDQFSEAQSRDNLVVVETEVPESELTSGYKAEKAKDSVGLVEWKAGIIQGQLTGTRAVVLSRWAKPVRIVPADEVGEHIAKMLEGTGIVMPSNVVTPQQRAALEARGVPFVETDNTGTLVEGENAGKKYGAVYGRKATRGREGQGAQEMDAAIGALLGKSRSERSAYTDRAREQARKAGEALADKLGLKVEFVDAVPDEMVANMRPTERKKAKRSKGWYDSRTGRIVVVVGNHGSADDVLRTVLHEGVAHHGLRELFGEDFDTFLDNVYNNAEYSIKLEIDRRAKANGWSQREATEEYLASLAEGTNFEQAMASGWWMKIKNFFLEMLRKVGKRLDKVLTDADLRYILYRSYENLKLRREGLSWPVRDIVTEANDVSTRRKLGVLEFEKGEEPMAAESEASGRTAGGERGERAESEASGRTAGGERGERVEEEAGNGVRFRAGGSGSAREDYDRRIRQATFQMQEAMQDSMLSLKELMRIVLKAEGKGNVRIEDVAGYENAYLLENALSSKTRQVQADYKRQYIDPLMTEVAALAHNAAERQELNDYVMAKHGLERNAEMNRRAAKEKFDREQAKLQSALNNSFLTQAERDNIVKEMMRNTARYYGIKYFMTDPDVAAWYQSARKRLDTRHNNGDITDERYAELSRLWDNLYEKGEEGTIRKDYAGLTGLTGESDIDAITSAAEDMVQRYESDHDTSAMWDAVRAATKASLKKMYDSGMMSKDAYDTISGMYEYYVPLRGWDEVTSDEVYAYLTPESGAYTDPLKAAKGRKSKADDPFAYIISMGDSAISLGERNMMKQAFLSFAQNHPSDAISVNQLWLEYDAATDTWQPALPDLDENDSPEVIARKVNDHEERMKQLAASEPDKYKSAKEHPHIPYKVTSARNKQQHQVIVRRGGETYVITINGNPRAALALNGLTNPNHDDSGAINSVLRSAEIINRYLSDFATSKNPDFVMGNFVRDMFYSNSAVLAKEGVAYGRAFAKNFGRLNPATMLRLFSMYESYQLDMSNPIHRMFQEFMMDGGETGYVDQRGLDVIKSQIARELAKRNGNALLNGKATLELLSARLNEINRAVENCARFAAYVTSREAGRSVIRSVYDAKEVTVNFNKKGAGDKMMGATGQTKLGDIASFISGAGRSLYMFWNPGVQGITNFLRVAGRNPIAGGAIVASLMAVGLLQAWACGLVGGDDDDDDYMNLPEYVRRSSLVIPLKRGKWLTLSLPIEYRAFFGLGELAYNVLSGKEHMSNKELALTIAEQASSFMPLNTFEGVNTESNDESIISQMLSKFVPSAMAPGYDVYLRGKTWYGTPIDNSHPWNASSPEYTKARKSTNQTLVKLCEKLNEASGGDEFKSGKVDINPARMEYLIKQYFSGPAKFLLNTAYTVGWAYDATGGVMSEDAVPAPELNKVPLARVLLKESGEETAFFSPRREYYRYKREAEETKRILKGYQQRASNGDDDYKEKLKELESSPEYRRMQIFDGYRSAFNSFSKMKKTTTNDEMLLKIVRDEGNTMREMNEKMREVD